MRLRTFHPRFFVHTRKLLLLLVLLLLLLESTGSFATGFPRSTVAVGSGTHPRMSAAAATGDDIEENGVVFRSSITNTGTRARMTYVAPETVRARFSRNPNGDDTPMEGAIWQEVPVWVENGRLSDSKNENNGDNPSIEDTKDLFQLHRHGFSLLHRHILFPTTSTTPSSTEATAAIDFLSQDDVLDRYYPHCQQVLEQYLNNKQDNSRSHNGVKVWAFDHNVRIQQQGQEPAKDDSSSESIPTASSTAKPPPKTQTPLAIVHGDYTAVSGPRRIQLLAEAPKINDVWRHRLLQNNNNGDDNEAAQPLLDPAMVRDCLDGKRRYALINLWRNIDVEHPVESVPLACLDATTLNAGSDLRVLEVQYEDRVGENFLVCCPPDAAAAAATAAHVSSELFPQQHHRWVYFPCMRHDECMLIQQWDSAGDFARGEPRDTNVATMAIHSAFEEEEEEDASATATGSPTNARRRRQSIEVRLVAIWDPVL